MVLPSHPKRTFVRFDTERNWQFVKALVTSPKADVQWIFLARWLEALLIEHARARGEERRAALASGKRDASAGGQRAAR
jgi:hypothetical protein